jgi:outer membrane immunogenic protein
MVRRLQCLGRRHNERNSLDRGRCCRSFDRGLRRGLSGRAGQGAAAGARHLLLDRLLFLWTGCYIGVEGGGNWGRSAQIARIAGGVNDGLTITGKFDLNGGIAGGTVGCNVQLSNFVLGGENDFSWTNKRGTVNDLPPFAPGATSSTREKWIDTLRGRFGYAVDRFLVYGTSGVAFAGTEVVVATAASGAFTDSKDRVGWVVVSAASGRPGASRGVM